MNSWLKYIDRWMIPVLLLATAYLAFNNQRNATYNSYQDVIWADAAGYHMYWPGLLLYDGYEGDLYPEGIQQQIGNGFHFDDSTGRAVTKYTYGVALMQTPFFLAAHAGAAIAGEPTTGYSRFYYWAVMLAAVCYGMLGLMVLKRYLRRRFSLRSALLTTFFIYLGTNLYYYMIDDSGMSHAYSFFLFALVLDYTDRYYNKGSIKNLLGIAIPLGLAVIIRPTSAVIVVFILFYHHERFPSVGQRFLFWFKRMHHVGIIAVVAALFWVPHLVYNHHVTGIWQLWTYTDEGFIYATAPKFAEVFMSPMSGMLPYVPMMAILFLALIAMSFRRKSNIWPLLFVLIVVTYLFASWHAWHFGCSFGQRSYVEYLPLLAIPLTWLFDQAFSRNRLYVIALAGVLLLASIYTLQLAYAYDECYFGNVWDYEKYWGYFDR